MVEGPNGLQMLESPLAGVISGTNTALLADPARASGGAEEHVDAWIVELDLDLDEGEDEEEEFEELPVWVGSDSVDIEIAGIDLMYDGDDDIRSNNAAFLLEHRVPSVQRTCSAAAGTQQQWRPDVRVDEFECRFAKGPLGLSFAVMDSGGNETMFQVEEVAGQAAKLGVQRGDRIVSVGERELTGGLDEDDFVGLVAAARRPLSICFARPASA